MQYLQRFGLAHEVFPQNTEGDTFFETSAYRRLDRRFDMLARQPGLGVLVGDVGVGKTSAIRNLCSRLPRPDYRVVYVCDTAVTSAELYRHMASELGLHPAHRRGQLWRDLKHTMSEMVDEQGVQPLLVIDEAHRLSDGFLTDLCGFLNFGMDSRNVLTVWLLGQPHLVGILRMKSHAALGSRIVTSIHLPPISSREEFLSFLAHGVEAAGATTKVVSDPAAELLFRASRGVPREAARLLREALIQAHERDQSIVDEPVLEAVLDAENL